MGSIWAGSIFAVFNCFFFLKKSFIKRMLQPVQNIHVYHGYVEIHKIQQGTDSRTSATGFFLHLSPLKCPKTLLNIVKGLHKVYDPHITHKYVDHTFRRYQT